MPVRFTPTNTNKKDDKIRFESKKDELNFLEDQGSDSVFADEVSEDGPGPIEGGVRMFSSAATFGQQPRISAVTDYLLNKMQGKDKPYGESLTENQIALAKARIKHKAMNPIISWPTAAMATGPAAGESILARLGLGAGFGALYGSEQQELDTTKGLINTGVGAGMGMGAALIPSAAKGGSDFVKGAIKEAETGGTTVKNLVRDYVVKKHAPETLETIVKKPKIIKEMADEGADAVEERLGKNINPFRESAAKNVEKTIDTQPEYDVIKNKLSELEVDGKNILGPSRLSDVISIQKDLGKVASQRDLLNITDKIKDRIDFNMGENASNLDRRMNDILVPVHKALKDKLRDPKGEWGMADEALREFKTNEKPAVKALEKSRFDFAKKSAQADFPKLDPEEKGFGYMHPSPKGVIAKALQFLDPKGGLTYTDKLSEDVAQKLVDPDYLMQLIQEGDKEILPNVKPTGLYKILEGLGYFDKEFMGTSTYNVLGNAAASQAPRLLDRKKKR